MSVLRLFQSGDATTGADGRAVVSLQPLRAFETWDIRRITVQSNSQTLVPTCKIYRGGESSSRLVDGTFTGTLDHSDTNMHLENGEPIVAVWETGDVGSICTLTIEGTIRR